MEHVVSGTGDPRVIPPALPNKFKKVVDTREDIIHEDDSVKELVVRVPKFVEWDKCLIPDLSEVLDTMIELSPRACRRAYRDSKPNCLGQRIEYAEKRLCLVGGAVFVNRHVDIMIAQDSRYPKERCK